MKFGAMKAHRRDRLLLIGLLVAAAGGAVTFALMALNENINLFYAPEQIVAGEAPVGKMIRAGGMVLDGSVVRSSVDLTTLPSSTMPPARIILPTGASPATICSGA